MPLPSVAGSATMCGPFREETFMRSILLYLIGVPIPIILIIALFTHHF